MSTRTTWRRALYALTAASAGLAAFTIPATAAQAHENGDRTITVNGSQVFPESVAADHRYVYTASMADGTVYRGRVGAKTLDPFLPAGQNGRTQVTGVKLDGDRLLLAGGFTGHFFVYTSDGQLVSDYTVAGADKTLVNDAAVAANGDVYVTDSFRAVVYRLPAAEVHAPAAGAHRPLQVAYHLPDYVAGTSNGNGIVATPDGRSLIVGYWNSGALYRLTLATGEVRKIDAPALTSADGMVLRGNTLYVARSVDTEIATVRLSPDYTRATVLSERTYPGADTPTGIAVSGDRLLVTNSQLDTFLYGVPLKSPVFSVENLPLR
jgi:sugar lactone lactonase YvrE